MYLMIVTHAVTKNTGFFAHGESGAWNMLLCSVNVVSATSSVLVHLVEMFLRQV
jgi:hypothetical protein